MNFKEFKTHPRQKRQFVRQSGPACQALFRDPETSDIKELDVWLMNIFNGDICCVFCNDPTIKFGANGFWLLRNGIDWECFLPKIVKCYQFNLDVPKDFYPKKKITNELLENMIRLNGSHLIQIFQKLRLSGILPPTINLTSNTCPEYFRWSNVRKFFQDFKGVDFGTPRTLGEKDD